MRRRRRVLTFVVACVILFCFSIQIANATVVFIASGTSSTGAAVSFKAQLTISGNTLTVQLTNNSPMASLNPNDTLGSFYFDILGTGNSRPTLTYTSATGDLYTVSQKNPDMLYQAGADLKALSGKNSWIFKTMNATANPYRGFGIGTVGNNNLSPNNFPGMDGIETSIYTGEITTKNLDGYLLVKNTATFTFTGLTGFTEANIVRSFAFGLGTSPDSLLVPEPATLLLLGLGAAMLRRKHG